MPTLYGGKSASISFNPALTVTGASNTNPITITVSGALPASFYVSGGLGGTAAGPLVDISGVQGNTAANGQFVATPTGASTFTIPAVGSGAYTSGGSVQPLDMLATPTVPSDGDLDNEASIDSLAKAACDRTQFLSSRIGRVKHAIHGVATFNNPAMGSPWCHQTATLTAGTVSQLVSDGVAWGQITGPNTFFVVPNTIGVAPVFAAHGLLPGDEILVQLDTFIAESSSPGLGLYYALVAPSGPAPAFGAYSSLFATKAFLSVGGPVTLRGALLGGGSAADLYIQPILLPTVSGAQVIQLTGDTIITLDVYRATLVPQ